MTDPSQAAVIRQKMRRERQARVGLLRNLNQPPRLAPRRAQLMGKWLDLRSSRRAPTPQTPDQPTSAAIDQPPVTSSIVSEADGQVSGVNIDGLNESIRTISSEAPLRAPYASGYRHDLAPSAAAAKAPSRRSNNPAPPPAVDEAAALTPVQPKPVRAKGRARGFALARILRNAALFIGGVLLGVAVLAFAPVLITLI